MIQSVGTPYGGSPIARLASLGDFLGVGCGANDDLTVNGAARWQRMIPFSVQEQVFYYTTQVSWHTRSCICFQVALKFIHLCLCMYIRMHVSLHMSHAHYMEDIGSEPEVM